MQHSGEDDNQAGPSIFEQFWSEALSMTHFVLLSDLTRSSDQLSSSSYCNIATMDAHCPTLLQQVANFLTYSPLGVVDQEFIGKYTSNRRFLFFALYGTWEALGGLKIRPWGVGTVCRRRVFFEETQRTIAC